MEETFVLGVSRHSSDLPHISSEDGEITVVEGKESLFVCESYGSRPQASVMWNLNGRSLSGENMTATAQPSLVDDDASVSYPSSSSNFGTERMASMSSVKIVPSLADHKAVLTCAAYSPKLPDQKVIEQATLNVLCKKSTPLIQWILSNKFQTKLLRFNQLWNKLNKSINET